MVRRLAWIAISPLLVAIAAEAQRPAEAVDLAKVKIPEMQKSDDLCPVHLVPSAPDGPTWTHDGVTYRGSAPDAKDLFLKDPAKYVEAHRYKRWENNYIEAMSRVWCPVTDQLNPGGLEEWNELGIPWESCCTFCSQTVSEEHFPAALERLKQRALESYKLTGGVYVEGAVSPVEGAIRTDEEVAELLAKAGETASSNDCYPTPAWVTEADLQPTYAGGVALIFANRCIGCHRPGGLSPIDFTTFQGIRNWTKNMKAAIVSGAMPPWPADNSVGCFSNAALLTQTEKDVLVAWCDAQFPRGEGELPELPAFGEWNIGEPDAVLTLPEYTVPKEVTAEYKEFEVATEFPEDRWIVASEIRPEDPFLVTEVQGGPLGSFYPGNAFEVLPAGAGRLLKAGEKVKVRVRYVKEQGWEAQDATQIALKFGASSTIKHAVYDLAVTQASLTIPADAKSFEANTEYKIERDSILVSLLPNMRERGNRITVSMTPPGGAQTQLLHIPRWRHKWRMRYQLREAIALPAGSVIRIDAAYDNSSGNTDNPNPETAVKASADGETLECWLGLAPK